MRIRWLHVQYVNVQKFCVTQFLNDSKVCQSCWKNKILGIDERKNVYRQYWVPITFQNRNVAEFFKGNTLFLFLVNSQKSDASWVYIAFPRVTQTILTLDIFPWLELFSLVLLKLLSMKKTFTHFIFNILATLKNIKVQRSYFWRIARFL